MEQYCVRAVEQSCGVGLWNHGEQGLRSRAVQRGAAWSRRAVWGRVVEQGSGSELGVRGISGVEEQD